MNRDAGTTLMTATRDATGRQRLFVQRVALRVVEGPDRGLEREVSHTPWVIGKHQSCDLPLGDPTISARHAEISLLLDGYLLRDLGSRNGLLVCGGIAGMPKPTAHRGIAPLRVVEAFLSPSLLLLLGDTVLEVVDLHGRSEMELSSAERFGSVIGRSPLMRHVFSTLETAADSDMTVLLEGESGTGKTELAEALHNASPRAGGPFVVLDCGAIPSQLLESELFGHERGAFTGAVETRVGAMEQAAGGTLFLDEISELSMKVQPKLLRAVERGQFRRIGANKTRSVDVRVIAATNRDVARLVEQRRFREDLYYRLAVLKVRVPPLRERLEDLPALVERFWQAGGHAGSIQQRFPGLMALLSSYRWPGNVRELRNLIERLSVLPLEQALPSVVRPGRDAPAGAVPFTEARDRAAEQFEVSYLRELLEAAGGNVTRAAELAGVSRRYLTRLMARHDMRRGDFLDER